MSSGLATGGGMEEELEMTRLCVGIGGGGGGRRNEGRPATDDGGASAATRRGKKGSRIRGGGRDSAGAGCARKKKLRLTGEQAALLEESFRAHRILSHGVKHDLAQRLWLQPRQVEVWFQNRRARTKLKQTEVDRDLLRQWCDRLTDENARLRREIAEARGCSASPAVPPSTAAATTAKEAAAACPSSSAKIIIELDLSITALEIWNRSISSDSSI